MIICAREGCEILTEKKTHNMKYCCDECCRLATNSRIMEKYYERRDQRQGKIRLCGKCSKTKLSRYNNSRICSACKTKTEFEANQAVLTMLLEASLAS